MHDYLPPLTAEQQTEIDAMVAKFRTQSQDLGSKEWAPTKVKTYETVPRPVRFFFPQNYNIASGGKPLPLMFTIHGGGWVIGSPTDDDHWNYIFADATGILVASLGYRLAPEHPFPQGLEDLVRGYLNVVNDETLPIDYDRVAIGGFSAGGNLALAVCQDAEIRKHKAAPMACILLYASFDMQTTYAEKTSSRTYKAGKLPGIRGADSGDPFGENMMQMFFHSYIPKDQKLTDPRLSPLLAKREDLPAHIFAISAELDLLAYESIDFFYRMTGRRAVPVEFPGSTEPKEPKKLDLIDPRYNLNDDEGGVRWLLVPDTIHGFDFHIGHQFLDEEGIADAVAKTHQYIDEIKKWLAQIW